MEEFLPARAEVHWDEASADGEESEEGLEMTEGEDNVELGGNSGLYSQVQQVLGHSMRGASEGR